jgi:hypothetical protein
MAGHVEKLLYAGCTGKQVMSAIASRLGRELDAIPLRVLQFSAQMDDAALLIEQSCGPFSPPNFALMISTE